jgi:AcrR family transcriptional regulator
VSIATNSAKRQRPRADAVRNRERILDAARDAFVRFGPDAPLDEIARRAGVGNATLYRHFPDRASLQLHVLLHVNERIIERAEEALEADVEPFEALRRMVLDAAAERVGGLCPMLRETRENGEDLDPLVAASKQRMHETTRRVIERAHAAGQLRRDVDAGDLLVAIARLTMPMPGSQCAGSERLARRHLQIFLDGLRTPARSTLPGRATTLADLEEEFR